MPQGKIRIKNKTTEETETGLKFLKEHIQRDSEYHSSVLHLAALRVTQWQDYYVLLIIFVPIRGQTDSTAVICLIPAMFCMTFPLK